jgi:hypothetical protein
VDDLNKKYYKLVYSINIDNDIDDKQDTCVDCFFSDGRYCSVKNKYISDKTPLCWSYRNCFTMRASSDFQDDNEDFYEYE